MCNACAAAVKLASIPYESDANEWLRLAREQQASMRDLALRLRSGEIAIPQWRFLMLEILKEGHKQSHLIGQRMAGTLNQSVGVATFAGYQVAGSDSGYLFRFANDLDAGRLDDDQGMIDVDRLMNRGRLYIGKMRGTQGQGFVFGSPEDVEFNWRLGGPEDHCTDCPVIAAASPFTAGTIFTHPGMGDTPCLGNCNCYWEREDGVISARAA